jgi:hypothetical protein
MAQIKSERSWLSNTTPQALLAVLHGKRMPRLRRLFAAACCRGVLDAIIDQECRLAIEVAERYADGLASREDLDEAYRAAQEIAQNRFTLSQRALRAARTATWDVWRLAYAAQLSCAPTQPDRASALILERAPHLGHEYEKQTRKAHCDLIRDIFGNPFRVVEISPSLLQWDQATIPKLAQAAYDRRALPSGTLDAAHLGILADALEEAGCTDDTILSHCRAGGEHVRGCWLIDLLRGRG